MTQEKSDSRMHQTHTEELLSDYLSDMFGGSSDSASKESELLITDQEVPVPSGLSQKENTPLSSSNVVGSSSTINHLSTNNTQEQATAHNASVRGVGDSENVQLVETNAKHEISGLLDGGRARPYTLIPADSSLIPTISLCNKNGSQDYRSQVEAQILLLTFLYFLRRPLSRGVRLSFLSYSEQVIDDFNIAPWLAQQLKKGASK